MNLSAASRLIVLLIVFLFPSIAAAQIPQFDSFYVFGDSLVDNGNILIQTTAMRMEPPVPPSTTPHQTYFQGRFSNGYTAAEFLWERLGGGKPGSPQGLKPFLAAPLLQKSGAVDFAFGGTGTPYVDTTPGGFSSPGLKGQVELFRFALRGKKPSDHALYVVATGANDYRADPFNVPMSPDDVVKGIEESIRTLYGLGARHIIVVDLPDLGKIPANAMDETTSAQASWLSAIHNALFDAAVTRLRSQYPRLHLTAVKLDPLFRKLQLDGFDAATPLIAEYFPTAPMMAACLFIGPATCQNVPQFLFNAPFQSIFWDVVHPTTEAHESLSEYMYQQLQSEYQ